MKPEPQTIQPVSQSPIPSPRFSRAIAPLFLLLVLAVSAWIAGSQVLTPPRVVPSTAPAQQFSGERALSRLRVIASEPHPVGSPANARVREYLLGEIQAMGLSPVLQDATAALPGKGGLFASNLHNILVRIPGARSTGAVAVMAHYDSQPNTPGASDNGAAVAGLLETLRALQSGPKLRNDLIFVLTDAEEMDAQGADAFFWQHPWAKEVRVLVNFEGAGISGASLLMETSPGNRSLAEGFLRAVPHPVAYSFMTQLLGIIPLGTDMTVFSENGVPSLSPMFGWGYHVVYHSYLDNVAALDPRSVQHQGENALGLARYFGDQDLAALRTGEDLVFFTLFRGLAVQYPAGWAVPLAILAALSLVGVLVLAFRRRQLTLLGILGGFVSALALALVPLIPAAIAWIVIDKLHPEFWRSLMGAPYQADLYFAGLVALVAATSLALFVLIRRKGSGLPIILGAALVFLILALLTSFSLPGISYLFAWPVLLASLGAAVLLSKPAGALGPARLGVLALAGAANVLLFAPIILLLFMLIGFWFLEMDPGMPFILVPLLFLALLLAILTPQVSLLARTRKWLGPIAAGLLAAGFLAAASLSSGFSAGQPVQNGVWYSLNADDSAAAWYSFGEKPEDPWTAQFFAASIQPVDLPALYASIPGNPVPPAGFEGPAPAADLPAPALAILSDRTSGEVRILDLRLSSPRQARGLLVKVSGAQVLAASVNGNRQTDPRWAGLEAWYLRFYGLPEQGIELRLEVRPAPDFNIVVTDQSDGLPQLPGVTYTPRSPEMMPFAIAQEYMPFPETTSVSKTYRLP